MSSAKHLVVFCEGQTEQGFCVKVLQPHLFPQGDGTVYTIPVGEMDHHHLYGIGKRTKFARVRKFILNTIKQRQGKNVYFTTLIDLYALPADFPGKDANVRNPADPAPYVCALEEALRQSIGYYRIPEYDGRKSSAGPDIAAYIGIATIRVKCPHFHLWLVQLENLQWE